MKRTRFIKGFALIMSLFIAFTTAGCGGCSPTAESEIKAPRKTVSTLVENGRSDYKVLISKNPEIVERTAATELVKYVEKTTGCKLPVITDDKAAISVSEKYISVGENRLTEKVSINNDNLNKEGYVLKTVGKTLFILGQMPKATLFGVYGFLEREMDVKFLTAKYEHVPVYSTFELKELNERVIPAIANRTVFNDASNNYMYISPKNGYSVFRTTDPTEIGGTYQDAWALDAHSMDYLVSYQENKSKEGWYGISYMPCLSNGLNLDGTIDDTDSYIRATIEAMKQRITSLPHTEFFILGQPDSGDEIVCNCSKCTDQLSQLEWNRSAQFMIWANTVAKYTQEWVKETYPERDVKFARTAYQWSEGAPVKKDENGKYVPITPECKPRDDMGIYFIPINGCYIHPITDEHCAQNSTGSGLNYKLWKELTDYLAIFDYNINYHDYLAWFPNMNVLQKNIQHYYETGVISYLLEGSLRVGNGHYQQDMQGWVAAKLMWDPYLNLTDLVSEFNRYYFGEDAGAIADELVWYMEAHFNYRSKEEGKVLGSDRCTRIYTGYYPWMVSATTLSKLFLNNCYARIGEMRKIYATDNSLTAAQRKQYEDNLISLEVQIDYMKYKNYDAVSFTTESEKFDFMVKFFDRVELLGINRLRETGDTVYEIRKSLGY